jgi:hypothetical protein
MLVRRGIPFALNRCLRRDGSFRERDNTHAHGFLGLMLLFGAAPVVSILTWWGGKPALFAPVWVWWLVLAVWALLTVGGYRYFTRDRVLRRIGPEGTIEIRSASGTVATRCSQEEFVIQVCPLRVQVLSRPRTLFWNGFALTACVGDQKMLIACDRSQERLKAQLRRAPHWVEAAYCGEGEAIEGIGDVRFSELRHARAG